MTKDNLHGPSGERYRPRPLLQSEKIKPLEGESSEALEERRRNLRATEIMEAYEKGVKSNPEVAKGGPDKLTFEQARKMVDDAAVKAKSQKLDSDQS